MNPHVDSEGVWIYAAVALVVGLVGGVLALLALRRLEGDEDGDTAIADLDEQASHIIALLRDLEDQRPRLDPALYASEKARLERQAADVIRARDQRTGARRKQRTAPKSAPVTAAAKGRAREVAPAARGGQLKGFFWGAGTVGVFAVLFWLVNGQSCPRADGQSMTGNSGGGTAMAPGGGGDPAVQAYLERLQQNPDDLEALLKVARALLRSQAHEQAKMLIERALSIDPNNPEGRVYAAMVSAAQDDPAGAISQIDRVLKDFPTFADAWFFRGMLAMQRQDMEQTKESWTKYVEYAPPSPQRDRIAGFLRGEGLQMPAAGGGAPSAAGGPPGAAPAMAGGRGPMMGGGSDEAALRARLEQNPDDVEALVDLGRALLRQQRFGEAQELVQRAQRLAPQDAGVRVNAAVLQSARGDAKGALAALDQVLEADPKYADAWFFRGMLGMQSGDAELAQQSWQRYVDVAPDGPRKDRIRGFLRGEGLQMPR